ncbi:MAG: hypothetical protein QOD42_2945 [Sphingomonadales bacterium]|jgi:hypothetical protein|nr:hypothetical protein [Sphingomonadales bacterium]
MNKLLLGILAAAGLVAPFQAAQPRLPPAQGCRGNFLGSYSTVISAQDLVASDGLRLGTVQGIIQQDRANLHRFHRGDRGDGYDDMFLSAESRALIPRWRLQVVPPPFAAAIRRGNARINVRVFEGCIEVRPA